MTSIPEMFSLTGKVALVTGAGGLLGRQHCGVLAEAGAAVVLADARLGSCEKAAEELRASGHTQVLALETDVSDAASVEETVARALSAFGRIDVLVNNAAMTVKGGTEGSADYFAPVEEYPLELWQAALGVNLTGTFLCAKHVGRHMVGRGSGSIINICSTYGLVGPDQRIYDEARSPYDTSVRFNTPPSYSATKGGILALTRYLATYWASKGIRVNALTPGGVYDSHNQEFEDAYSRRTPLGRMAKRWEYRGAVLYLASDASSYMTGANLVVDGGWTAW